MTAQEKIDLHNHIKRDTGDKLDVDRIKSIERFIDDRELQIRKDQSFNQLGTRLMYGCIFGIIFIWGWFQAGWKFNTCIAILGVYNFIHALNNLYYFRKKFEDIELNGKD